MLNVDTSLPPAGTRARRNPRSLALGVGDVCVRVEGLPPVLHQRFSALVAPFVTRTAATCASQIRVGDVPGAQGWRVACDGQAQRSFTGPEALLKYLEWLAFNRAMCAMTDRVAFHAAALSRGESTVLLLGKSGAGKTTLTLGLIARGWQPLSDDIVLVDPATLGVKAFPRCFHLDEGTRDLVGDRVALEWPGKLDGYARPTGWAPGGRAATAIVVVHRCPTCMSARFPILQAEAAGALLAEAVDTQIPISETVRLAVRMSASAACYRLKNGPLDGSLNLIERACER